MYIEIQNNKITSWADWNFEGSKEFDIDYKTFKPEKYEVENGELISIENSKEYKKVSLEREKTIKLAENEAKRNVEFIETTFGKLKCQTPLGDLKVIAPNIMFMAELSDGLPKGFLRFYDSNNEIYPSEKMNKEKTIALYQEILMAYTNIDAKSTQLTESIKNAETIEELNNIVITY